MPSFRGVDVLANVAGIGSTTTAPETPLAVWEDVFAVNARGTFLCCKHAIPGMIERGGGSIVNIASAGGLVGLRNRAAYCASKGAVIAMTRALAVDHVGGGRPRQRGLPGNGRLALGRADWSRMRASRSRRSARASRWGGSGRRTRSPRRCSIWRRTMPRS